MWLYRECGQIISDDQDGKMARYFRVKNEKGMFLY